MKMTDLQSLVLTQIWGSLGPLQARRNMHDIVGEAARARRLSKLST